MKRLYHRVRPMVPQMFRYLMSGGSAAFLQLGSFKLMEWVGVWYLTATIISGAIGFVSAFTFHKYFVFRKKENTASHGVRYVILQSVNAVAQIGIVYLLVEFAGVDPFIANILSIGVVVSWNFFLYKFFVYV